MMFSSEQVLETHVIADTTGVFCCPRQLHTCSAQGAPFIDHAMRVTPVLATWVSSLDERRTLRVQKQEADPMYREFVYVLKAGPYYKIGRTLHLEQRTAQIALQMPFPVELFKVINTDNAAGLEALLHLLCYSDRVNGEWFRLSSENALKLWIFPPSYSRTQIETEGYDLWGMWRALNEDADANCMRSVQEE
jgi:hypothetical protein